MKTKLLFILLCGFVLSCNDDFQLINTSIHFLEPKDREVILDATGTVTSINHNDSLLIVSRVSTEKIFSLDFYDENGEAKYRFSNTDWSEWDFPRLLNISDFSDNAIYVYDYKKLRLLEIDVNESFNENRLVFSTEYLIPGSLRGIQEAYLFGDSLMVGLFDDTPYKPSDQASKKIFRMRLSDSKITTKEIAKYYINSSDILDKMNANARVAGISKERGKMVIASKFAPLIEIYDIKNDTLITINYGTKQEYSFEKGKFRDRGYRMFGKYVSAGDYRFGLLMNRQINSSSDSRDVVSFYDWEGEYQETYDLSGADTFNFFYMNEEDNSIYGSSYKTNELIKFNLNP